MPRSRTSVSMCPRRGSSGTPWTLCSVRSGSMSKAATIATAARLAGEVREDGVARGCRRRREPRPGGRPPPRKLLDAVDAGVDVIAPVGAARVADDHEVAAHLGGADHGVAGELVGVDALDALVVQRGAAAAGSGSSELRSCAIPRRSHAPRRFDPPRSLQNKRCEICHDSPPAVRFCQLSLRWTRWTNGEPRKCPPCVVLARSIRVRFASIRSSHGGGSSAHMTRRSRSTPHQSICSGGSP